MRKTTEDFFQFLSNSSPRISTNTHSNIPPPSDPPQARCHIVQRTHCKLCESTYTAPECLNYTIRVILALISWIREAAAGNSGKKHSGCVCDGLGAYSAPWWAQTRAKKCTLEPVSGVSVLKSEIGTFKAACEVWGVKTGVNYLVN